MRNPTAVKIALVFQCPKRKYLVRNINRSVSNQWKQVYNCTKWHECTSLVIYSNNRIAKCFQWVLNIILIFHHFSTVTFDINKDLFHRGHATSKHWATTLSSMSNNWLIESRNDQQLIILILNKKRPFLNDNPLLDV